jgi:hypothetical protein
MTLSGKQEERLLRIIYTSPIKKTTAEYVSHKKEVFDAAAMDF